MYDAVRAVVEPKWSLEILEALSKESPQNFSAIDGKFETSSDVITRHLRLLVDYGLVERTEYSRRDVRYGITDEGDWFLRRIIELDRRLDTE